MKLCFCALTAFLSLSGRQEPVTFRKAIPVFLVHFLLLEISLPFFVRSAFLVPLLTAASVHDLQTGEIPDLCHLFIILFAFFSGTVYYADGLSVFLLLSPLSVAGLLGFGDVKLIASLTLFSGTCGFMILPLACLCALPRAIIKRDRVFPFAPFLSFSFLLIHLYRLLAG